MPEDPRDQRPDDDAETPPRELAPADAPTAPADIPAGERVEARTVDGPEVLTDSALGRSLIHAWNYVTGNLTWVAIALIAVVAISWAWRFRSNAEARAAQQAQLELPRMQQAVDYVSSLGPRTASMTADQLSTALNEVEIAFEASYSLVETGAQDDATLARAARLAGDYQWYLATLPTPLPATRPASEFAQLREPSARLDEAEAAYRRVVDDYEADFAQQVAAHFGLAAIAEERGDAAGARAQYQAVLDDERTPEPFKETARRQMIVLDEVERSLAGGGSPLAPPATRPAATRPAAASDEALSNLALEALGGLDSLTTPPITTQPAIATTQPATRPAE